MAILKLLPNKPYILSLRYESPVEKEGRWGKQFMYTLSDGSLVYVPPIAHQEIRALKPLAGEPFTILQTINNGNAAVWSVERIAQPCQPQPDIKPKPMVKAQSIAPASVPVPPSLTTRESIRIFNQLVATIQAVKAAEEFALSIGRPVVFGPEDIRAMGISGFIEQSRRAA